MLVKKSKEHKKIGPMKIWEYKINPNFSGALVEIDGNHGKMKCLEEDRIYFILDGNGKFIINEKEHDVSKDDLIFIPKSTPYNIIGKIRFLIIHSPEFNPEHDVSLR